ncbi:MAG: hypothetical protein ACI84C_002013 [Flavobacteriales bacterium]|jgi:hypothetical protein
MRIAFLLLRCRLAHRFGSNSAYAACWETLRSSHSYRLDSSSHGDKLIGFRYLRAALKMIFTNHQKLPNSENHVGLFRGGRDFESAVQYLTELKETPPDFFLCREDFGFGIGIINQLSMLIGLALISPWLIFMTITSSKRGTYAGIITDCVEIMHLEAGSRKRKIRTMWMFDSYERDSNLMSLALMNNGCKVIRVPSANIITPFYHHLVSTEFIFTAPFQPDEMEDLKSNWFVERTRNLPPFNYPKLLQASRKSTPGTSATLGYISSGVWRRKERGELASGLGEFESEDLLIDTLKTYLKDHSEKELLIYLHPCEKESNEIFARAHEEYSKHFPEGRFRIVPLDVSSLQVFSESEVAVSVYSSANIERLFLGLKTLYFPACFKENIYGNTSLSKVSATTPERLIALLDAGFNLDQKAFFDQFELNAYRGFGLPSHLSFKE